MPDNVKDFETRSKNYFFFKKVYSPYWKDICELYGLYRLIKYGYISRSKSYKCNSKLVSISFKRNWLR